MTSGPHHTGESQGFPLGTAPDLLVKNELGHASIVINLLKRKSLIPPIGELCKNSRDCCILCFM